MINPLLAALGGAFGAAIGYRTARLAPENRATALLLVTAAASLVLGAIARAGAIAHGSPAGAFLIGLCGTAVSFAALAWCLVRAERPCGPSWRSRSSSACRWPRPCSAIWHPICSDSPP